MSNPSVVTDDMLCAAMVAAANYDVEHERRRRAKSIELFGHGGAHIATVPFDGAERMRRALDAAESARKSGGPSC